MNRFQRWLQKKIAEQRAVGLQPITMIVLLSAVIMVLESFRR